MTTHIDDEKYYEEVDRVYYTYGTPAAQDYQPANQAPGPCQTIQELMQIFGKGRGQTFDVSFYYPENVGKYRIVFWNHLIH